MDFDKIDHTDANMGKRKPENDDQAKIPDWKPESKFSVWKYGTPIPAWAKRAILEELSYTESFKRFLNKLLTSSGFLTLDNFVSRLRIFLTDLKNSDSMVELAELSRIIGQPQDYEDPMTSYLLKSLNHYDESYEPHAATASKVMTSITTIFLNGHPKASESLALFMKSKGVQQSWSPDSIEVLRKETLKKTPELSKIIPVIPTLWGTEDGVTQEVVMINEIEYGAK